MWRARRWAEILDIIDRLPRTSAYIDAVSQDDDLADALGDRAQTQPGRRMADWSVEVELLTTIVDRLAELTHTVAALGGARPGRIRPAPRPRTAFDRAEHRRAIRAHASLARRLLPHKYRQAAGPSAP